MKKLFNILLLSASMLTCSVAVHGQDNANLSVGDSETIDIPAGMTFPLDSLLRDWKVKNYIDIGKDCETSTVNPQFPDSVYADRLSRMPVIMEMPYNDVVRKFIDMYTGRLRNNVAFMLSAGNFYIPIFEEALGAYNLPLELKYLPVIESAFNPKAVSRQGAAGLWQFMLQTGKIYGLEVNSLVDDRFDPIKSTWAAARYLKELYTIFNDWSLVIAAYNCGPGNITKAIHRAGGESDYWKIYPYLPKETQGYVPAFIAANYVMNYYCNHNICPMETNIPTHTDTIQVNQRLHLRQVAEVCGVSMEQLKSLNPQYKHDILPGNAKLYTLRLPLETVSTFIDNQDSIYAYRADEMFKNRAYVAVNSTASKSKGSTGGKGGARYHTVKKGETLGKIAARYHVTVKNLQRWNGLKGTNISAGKRLKISN